MHQDQKRALMIVAALGIVAMVAGGLFLAWVAADIGPSYEDTSVVAYGVCRQFVEKSLKVPGSGEWPSDVERDSEPLGEGRFRVRSHLVAKNAFGVPVRTTFTCTVEKQSDDDWKLISLDF